MRNNITHETEKLSFAKSVGFLTKYWTELCSLRQSHRPFDSKGKSLVCNSLAAGRREVKVQGELKWERPAEGWCKVNVDGAFDPTTGKGGIGFIIRDRAGSVLLSAWKYLQLAAEWYRGRVILESDCSYVVGLLREGNFRRSRLKFALEETVATGRLLPEWTCVHTRRERNRAARELAQLAKRTAHSAVWRFNAPVCVEQIIAL